MCSAAALLSRLARTSDNDHNEPTRPRTTGEELLDSEPIDPASGHPGRVTSRLDRHDFRLVMIVAIVTVLVHPVHEILTRPYWLDEAWVATLSKASLLRVPRLNASTPVGFVALLKFTPGSGLQRGRLVVLGFSVLSAAMAYVLVRRLRWESPSSARSAAVVAGMVVALVPFSLQRNDLKQYTCDAFCALVILCVASTANRSPGSRATWMLGAVALLTLPFSSSAAFVAMAAFAGLLVAQLLEDRRLAPTTLLVGAATGVLMASYFLAAVLPRQNAQLEHYWRSFYLTGSPWHVIQTTWARLGHLHRQLAIPRLLFVVLGIAGIVVLARLGERALAIAIPTLWLEMMTLGHARRYPFLDQRTSHFLLVPSVVLAVVGVIGVLHLIGHRNIAVAALAGLALGGVFLAGSIRHVYDVNIPREGPRAPGRICRAGTPTGRRHPCQPRRQLGLLVLLASRSHPVLPGGYHEGIPHRGRRARRVLRGERLRG